MEISTLIPVGLELLITGFSMFFLRFLGTAGLIIPPALVLLANICVSALIGRMAAVSTVLKRSLWVSNVAFAFLFIATLVVAIAKVSISNSAPVALAFMMTPLALAIATTGATLTLFLSTSFSLAKSFFTGSAKERTWGAAAGFGTSAIILIAIGLHLANHFKYESTLGSSLSSITSKDDLLKLFRENKRDWRVLKALMSNASRPEEITREMRQSNDPLNVSLVAKDPNIPRELVEQFMSAREDFIRRALSLNPALRAEDLERLSHDRSHEVRHNVAYNPQTPTLDRIRLAKDKGAYIRQGAAQSANTPK